MPIRTTAPTRRRPRRHPRSRPRKRGVRRRHGAEPRQWSVAGETGTSADARAADPAPHVEAESGTAGSETSRSRPAGSGASGSGASGSGVAGSGAAGSGASGSGVAGSGASGTRGCRDPGPQDLEWRDPRWRHLGRKAAPIRERRPAWVRGWGGRRGCGLRPAGPPVTAQANVCQVEQQAGNSGPPGDSAAPNPEHGSGERRRDIAPHPAGTAGRRRRAGCGKARDAVNPVGTACPWEPEAGPSPSRSAIGRSRPCERGGGSGRPALIRNLGPSPWCSVPDEPLRRWSSPARADFLAGLDQRRPEAERPGRARQTLSAGAEACRPHSASMRGCRSARVVVPRGLDRAPERTAVSRTETWGRAGRRGGKGGDEPDRDTGGAGQRWEGWR